MSKPDPISAAPLDKRLIAFARQALELLESSWEAGQDIDELARALKLGRKCRGGFRRIKELRDED